MGSGRALTLASGSGGEAGRRQRAVCLVPTTHPARTLRSILQDGREFKAGDLKFLILEIPQSSRNHLMNNLSRPEY